MNYYSINSSDSMQFDPAQSSPQQISSSQTTLQSPQPTPTTSSLSTKPVSSKVNSIKSFLNDNKGTLIMAAMGLSIGYALKDFCKEFIETIINSIVYLVTRKTIGGTLHLNIFKVFNSFISLIMIVALDYYIYRLL